MSPGNLEKHMSRFLLAVLRNCGVAIAISVFFAAARGPSHPPGPGVANASGLVEARYPESTASTQKSSGCNQPAGQLCRVLDAGQRGSERTP
jgi:hypothetical protein